MIRSSFRCASKYLANGDTIFGADFRVSGSADIYMEQLVAKETFKGSGAYRIQNIKLSVFRSGGWSAAVQDINLRPLTKDQATDYIFRSNERRENNTASHNASFRKHFMD